MPIDVHHLGRTGDVAGGMTQAINEYLHWDFPNTRHHRLASRAGGGVRDILPFLRAMRALRTLDPASAVVVAHLSQGGSFVREGTLLALAARRGLATVAQLHGSSFPAFAAARPGLVRRVLSSASTVLVLSAETEDAVDALGMGVPVVRIPNAVAGIDPQPKEQVVLFAGNVTRRKGVDVLLEAWRNLDPPGWRLVLAGPTPERDLLAHPPDRTEFVGSLPRGELHALLGRAAVAVLPSRREAMPLFVLEAMSAGAAAVSTRVGAIPDVLEGVGELVPPEDAPALGAALNRIITSDQHRATLAAAARKRYRDRYSPEAVIPALDEVFLAALAEPRRITRRNRGGDTTDSTRRSASRR